ncbi:MAG TPA: hypothetical protein QF555_01350 [Candidatus Thalassarchaeaceae archaeon]|nr:hypothetical protein [Candidatus Thalassarchaeaceae archaeon]
MRNRIDDSAASTEIGYVLTFFLGLMFLTTFSIWTFDIQQATEERWTNEAIQENLREIAESVERADAAMRLDSNASYAEPVELRLSADTGLGLVLLLDEEKITITDASESREFSQEISAASSATHSSEVDLAGVELLWISLHKGAISITTQQPGF